MKAPILFLFASLVLLSFDSCKKGCTNPKGVNYDPSAKEDDASCEICDSTELFKDNEAYYFRDGTTSSIHYQDTVLRGKITAYLYQYSGNACKRLGKVSGCDPDDNFHNFAYAVFSLTNFIEDTVVFFGNYQISVSSSAPVRYGYLSAVVIPPDSTVVFSPLYYNCVLSNGVNISRSFSNLSYQYH